jgi:hypothetical protein
MLTNLSPRPMILVSASGNVATASVHPETWSFLALPICCNSWAQSIAMLLQC